MMKEAVAFRNLDRLLLAIYLIALIGLLIFPVAGPKLGLFGIGADKWMHIALFGGLDIFLRWNFSMNRYAIFFTVGLAFIVAVAIEIVQGLVVYRSAEMWDLLAGLLGAVLGAVSMNRIMSSPEPEKSVGLLVGTTGLLVGTLFLLADVIGVGRSNLFGTLQMSGTALGVIITIGGIWIYVKGLRGEAHLS